MKRIEHKHTSSKALKFSVLLGGYKLSDRLDMLSNMTINLSSRSIGSSGSFNILSFGAPHPLLHVHYPYPHVPPSCSVCEHGSLAARHEQTCSPHCMCTYKMCASLAWLFQCSCTCRHAKGALREFKQGCSSKLQACCHCKEDRILTLPSSAIIQALKVLSKP